MQMLGLSDSGAIYVGTNNKNCTILNKTKNNISKQGSNREIIYNDRTYN